MWSLLFCGAGIVAAAIALSLRYAHQGRALAMALLIVSPGLLAAGTVFCGPEGSEPFARMAWRFFGWLVVCGAIVAFASWQLRAGSAQFTRERGIRSGKLSRILPLLVASALVLAGYCIRGVPEVQAKGWWAAVPSTAMIALMRRLPPSAIDDTPDPKHSRQSASLFSRLRNNELWAWQRAWMASRVAGRVGVQPSVESLDSCSLLLRDFGRTEFVDRMCDLCFRGLVDTDAQTRAAAAEYARQFLPAKTPYSQEGIAYLNKNSAALAPRLIPFIDDPNERVTWTVLDALSFCGADAAPARSRAVQIAFAEGDWMRGYHALKVLKSIGFDGGAAAAGLVAKIESPDRAVRVDMLRRAKQMGYLDEYAGTIIPALIARIRAGDDEESQLAAAAAMDFWLDSYLARIQDAIFEELKSSRNSRAGYLDALVGRYPLDPYLPLVIATLGDASAEVRAAAARLLKRRADWLYFDRGDLTPAVPALTRLASDPDERVRQAASEAIKAIQPPPVTPP